MRRYGSAERFLDLFGLVRELVPDIEIRTSFLLGYPGETEAHVEELAEFVRRARPEKLALFSYSQEEGTPGYGDGDPIAQALKADRVNQIRAVHLEVLREIHLERMNRHYRCMVDQVEADGSLVVRRAQDAPEVDEVVFLEAAESNRGSENGLKPGDLLDVEITGFYEYDMSGRRVGSGV